MLLLLQDCESPSTGVMFREQQCQAKTINLPGVWTLHNNRAYNRVIRSVLITANATESMECSLSCVNEGVSVLVASVVDGTPCNTGATTATGVCLGTLCVVRDCLLYCACMLYCACSTVCACVCVCLCRV